MNTTNKASKIKILPTDKPLDYLSLEESINRLCCKYKFLKKDTIGKSYLGKNINLLTIGNGGHKVIYIGAHHGMEWMTSMLLIRFTENFCRNYHNGVKYYNYDLDYIFDTRTIYIIPMLNPDGVDLSINGVDELNPIKSRLISMNNNSKDFSSWQANARGVDLNHNYDAGWEAVKHLEMSAGITEPCSTRFGGDYPESESETRAVTSFIRAEEDIRLLIALHSQGEEIYWQYANYNVPRAKDIANTFALSTGYKLCVPEKIASHGGCKDWFIEAFNRPAFTFECGRGKNPLPLSDFTRIYNDIEEALILGAISYSE